MSQNESQIDETRSVSSGGLRLLGLSAFCLGGCVMATVCSGVSKCEKGSWCPGERGVVFTETETVIFRDPMISPAVSVPAFLMKFV